MVLKVVEQWYRLGNRRIKEFTLFNSLAESNHGGMIMDSQRRKNEYMQRPGFGEMLNYLWNRTE
ncbi:hypothetical protein SAMN05216564_12010 [Halopenitus persicus]|uniref:Uncharacterized protein n=1 Tax=Halopenitus persicus TaxID=1048396 RepID=A0A1H3P6C5_9EURY|nr:hypothetical protein SAMN05216564_12010 [Halopenitus persicus]